MRTSVDITRFVLGLYTYKLVALRPKFACGCVILTYTHTGGTKYYNLHSQSIARRDASE